MNLICLLIGHDWEVDRQSLKTLPKVTYSCLRCTKTYEKIFNTDDVSEDSLLKFVLSLKGSTEEMT